MAKTLQIREVPEEIHTAVRVRAAQAGESVSDYLLALVSEIVAHPPMTEIVERAQETARDNGASSQDIRDVLREGRE